VRDPRNKTDPGECNEYPPRESPPPQQKAQQGEDQSRHDRRHVVFALPKRRVRGLEDQRPNRASLRR
jgi:hypothetical protein